MSVEWVKEGRRCGQILAFLIHMRGGFVFAVVLAITLVGCQSRSDSSLQAPVSAAPTFVPATVQRATPVPSNQDALTPTLRLTEGGGEFVIQLLSRQFVPEAGIASGLDWLGALSCERVHVLLQLYGPPDSSTKELLQRSGIDLLSYIPSNAWFASVPCSLQPDDPALAAIRWFGPILPEDKVHSDLLEGRFGIWALRDGNRVALEVGLFEDVSIDVGRQILVQLGATIIAMTPLTNKIIIEVPKDVIPRIAAEDVVRWVDQVPPPPTIDSDGEGR